MNRGHRQIFERTVELAVYALRGFEIANLAAATGTPVAAGRAADAHDVIQSAREELLLLGRQYADLETGRIERTH